MSVASMTLCVVLYQDFFYVFCLRSRYCPQLVQPVLVTDRQLIFIAGIILRQQYNTTSNNTVSLFSHSKHNLLAVVHCIHSYHTRTKLTLLRLQKQRRHVCFLMLTEFRKSVTFVERSLGLTGLFLCDE
jgi:hypothetical protein